MSCTEVPSWLSAFSALCRLAENQSGCGLSAYLDAVFISWMLQDDPRWFIADPICTFVFAILVLMTTIKILRDISDILMERVPRGHDFDTIATSLRQVRR